MYWTLLVKGNPRKPMISGMGSLLMIEISEALQESNYSTRARDWQHYSLERWNLSGQHTTLLISLLLEGWNWKISLEYIWSWINSILSKPSF